MIFVRILLGIIAFPFMILAYLLHYFFRLAVLVGTKIVIVIAGLAVIGGIIILAIENCGEPQYSGDGNNHAGIWLLVGGIIGCFLPYIAAFISQFFLYIAEWIKYKAYH